MFKCQAISDRHQVNGNSRLLVSFFYVTFWQHFMHQRILFVTDRCKLRASDFHQQISYRRWKQIFMDHKL